MAAVAFVARVQPRLARAIVVTVIALRRQLRDMIGRVRAFKVEAASFDLIAVKDAVEDMVGSSIDPKELAHRAVSTAPQ
jgi:hypothetical protein